MLTFFLLTRQSGCMALLPQEGVWELICGPTLTTMLAETLGVAKPHTCFQRHFMFCIHSAYLQALSKATGP